MNTIYHYSDDFNKNKVIEKVNELSDKIEEELKNETYDKNKRRELLYAQFIQGLKLSIK